ncbi:hypothetical protein TSMEX_002723 [Taenia solium]|eukprot:TsM_001093800 transcript=TsM_001093800 gene=TsM_001093800
MSRPNDANIEPVISIRINAKVKRAHYGLHGPTVRANDATMGPQISAKFDMRGKWRQSAAMDDRSVRAQR